MSQFHGASAGTLRALASAFRAGSLQPPLTEFAVTKAVSCPVALARVVVELAEDGAPSTALALILESSADVAELRASHVQAELVWSGPEDDAARSRDTMAVLEELFSSALRDVVVSTFVVHQPERVFHSLASRMDAVPGLKARIFLHIGRKPGDTALESELVREFGDRFKRTWPGSRLPEIFYDPRGLSDDAAEKASWHAKCVLVDEDVTLLTSANFTEWAQTRNVEAGALVRGRSFNAQLRGQLDGSVRRGLVRRVPGL